MANKINNFNLCRKKYDGLHKDAYKNLHPTQYMDKCKMAVI